MREGALDLDPAVDLALRSGQGSEQPQRRDQRRGPEVLDRRAHRVGLELGAPVHAQCGSELRVALQLEPVIICLALAELQHRQVVLGLSRRRLENEVGKAAVIKVAGHMHRSARVMKAELDGVAFLRAEVRIAHLERLASAVRPVGEQLVDRRRTRAVRHRQARAPPGRHLILPAERGRDGGEVE